MTLIGEVVMSGRTTTITYLRRPFRCLMTCAENRSTAGATRLTKAVRLKTRRRTIAVAKTKEKPTRREAGQKAHGGTERTVDQQLAERPHLDRESLQRWWETLFGHPAPVRVRRDLLRRVIAYRIQEKAYGGLKPATVRHLRRIVEGLKGGEAPFPRRRSRLGRRPPDEGMERRHPSGQCNP